MDTFIKLCLPFIVALGITVPAYSHNYKCTDRDVGIADLEKNHNEERAIYGISGGGDALFEVYVSPSGTWTATLSIPSAKKICQLADGSNFTFELKHLPIAGDDS